MEITVSGKQIALSDALHERIWQHLNALGRRYADTERFAAQVTLSRERRFFICEVRIQATGIQLHGAADAEDAYRAFDKAIESIAGRLAEARSRRYHRRTEPNADVGFRSLLSKDER